ncbi:MAG: bifunctional hydroxymethylpyrimidine kinase/phosphomethylpyrimidine kinase [Planctomycetota bacterium]|nr:bifunctional hydroxymethylpyrimidine kinase/phosphomethylpyrimidine kinase [Planctomycetota bacterium]
MRTALTIAGSDPSGGAGVQGDLKTFHACGVYGMAVLTALTAQNTTGVSSVHDVPADFVRAQLDAVLDDLPVHAAKTGMLAKAAVIEAVVAALGERPVPFLVVDPVMVATSGDPLINDEAVGRMVELLFPLATVVTPNLDEAARLLGRPVRDLAGMHAAAQWIRDRGAQAVLVKGGHLAGGEVTDLLLNGGQLHEWRDARIDTDHTHGSGCALAAALAASLAKGLSLVDAVACARTFVRRGLEQAVVLGKGRNPLNHLARPE